MNNAPFEVYTAVINGRWCGAERPECGAPAVG